MQLENKHDTNEGWLNENNTETTKVTSAISEEFYTYQRIANSDDKQIEDVCRQLPYLLKQRRAYAKTFYDVNNTTQAREAINYVNKEIKKLLGIID